MFQIAFGRDEQIGQSHYPDAGHGVTRFHLTEEMIPEPIP